MPRRSRRRPYSRAEEGRIWWGGQRRIWTPVGPQGAGRIEPLRGEHARPLFFERAWWGEFVGRSKVARTSGTICPRDRCWNDLSRGFFESLSQTLFLERFVPEVVFGTICPRGRFWNDLSQRLLLERFVPEVWVPKTIQK